MTTQLLTTDQLIDYLVGTTKLWMDGPEAQLMPQMTAEAGDGSLNLIALATEGHPINGVLAVAAKLRDELKAVRVSIVVDTYAANAKMAEAPQFMADRERFGNNLAAMFAADYPGVTEAVAITIVGVENLRMVMLPYVRTADAIEWGEVEDMPHPTGRMVEALGYCLA